MPPFRVTAVIETLGRGGAEHLLVDIAHRIDRDRFALDVCTLAATPADHSAAMKDLGVEVRSLELASVKDLAGGVRRLHLLLGQERPDLVHTHLFGANIAGRIAARWLHIPVISTLHSADYEPIVRAGNTGLTPFKHHVLRFLDIATLLLTRPQLVAVSQHVADSARRRLHVSPSRLHVIPNGIDTGHFRPVKPGEKAPLRASLDLPEGATIAISVGRLTREKAQDVLVRGAAPLCRSRPDFLVVLVGEGSLRPEIVALASRLGIANQVRLLGKRADVADLLRASDLLVLPSLHEGFGLVVVEAMASGIPVIVNHTDSMKELVEAGKAGLFFETADTPSLTAALDELLASPERRVAMGRCARTDAVERFTLDRMVRSLEGLYGHLLEGRLPRPTAS